MEAPVAVSVLPAAATIAEAAGVKLSRPDSPNALRRQAMILAARSVVRLHTAAEVRAEPLWDEVGGARVRVRASSPQGLDVEQLVRIDLSHRALPVGECEELFVSNSPERLHRPQSLLGAHLTGRSRLLYHHLNESGRTLRLVVELLNRGDLDEEVGLLVSAAGPAADEMHVGHTAAREFLRARSRTEGIALTVTPGAVLRVVDVRLPVGRIVSGLLELIPLAPQTQLAVRVRAIAPTEPDSPSTSLTETPQFVFGETSLREDAAYTVGGRWAFVSLGRHAISAKTGAHELAGNYGVVHEVTLSVHNPTREAALVKLVFAPAGGVARGTFLLGGELIETPMTQSGAESLLKAVPLPPGAHRKIRLLTMPESASNYPIRLIAKAD